ncbi:beta-1,6-N-acetylglucosaminyltransferase [Flagellimonas sp. HMM57]|uniref:beta-1,6-N-acetylglucosaminyltransferase n=1 Tax=unclassified Flagellimonas TaxID=2644544 RepID=UPI0013D1E412|nr:MULTISPECIES: beta-1,6-N-acetylglucosaminyltransferase [unclassified Flagellimonas]UII76127.1 beta-1,6-N-acetylglucosaminyltransferase [Flagellimonas sp. HMM57]
MPNTIAILILAHHNPEQLSLLVQHLQPDFDVYVQIDKKSDLQIDELPQAKNVFYYKEVAVYWGDFSQILNMNHILEKAYTQHKYERYCYISGDDLPIKSNQYIKDFFKENKDSIYMYANPLPIKTWGFNYGFDRLDRYWFMRINHRKTAKILGRTTLVLQRMLGIKRKRYPIDYYAGSNWLNLTGESVSHIFDFLKKYPDYFKKLKYSRATDEIWIQSIVMNSIFKEKVINDDLRYIDWNTGPEFPRTLTSDDYTKIKSSNALFARKFNSNKDFAIIQRLVDGK